MFSALLFLQFHTVKNRLVARVKRLKQPKYLVGAIVGGLYFYFYFFHWMFHANSRYDSPAAASPVEPLLYQSFGALILLVIMLSAWIFPHKRAALTFTEAEVAFLFPAPITRRGLINFKLARSQIGILFSALFFALISRRFSSHGGFLIHAAGWWIVLSTLNLHFLGSSFALTLLMDRGISTWKRRLLVLALVLAGFGAVVVWGIKALPPLSARDLANVDSIMNYAKQFLQAGPLPYLLWPFRLIVRPYLAGDSIEFLRALWPALLLLLAHYFWVIRSDVAFEEASLEASQKFAEKIAAARAGRWQKSGKKLKSKRPPFKLSPVGLPPVALLWKNLVAAGQGFSARTWSVLVWIVIGVVVGMRSGGGSSNWLPVIGMMAAMFGVWSVLLGPQFVRFDFRQDLPLMDVLKSYPMSGWQIVLGEILAPAVILTGVQWLLLILAAGFFSQTGRGEISGGLVLAISVGAAVVLPMLNLISLLIPNAAVLLFPAWFQTGKDAPQGIEATGQRIIFVLGQFLAFAVALIPAALMFAIVFFIAKILLGVTVAVLLAAVATTVILAVEAGFGVWLLGSMFKRFDLSSETTN